MRRKNGDVHAFADEVKALGAAALPAFTSHVWYRTPTEADRQAGRFDSEGLMDLAAVADNIRDPQMQYYLCGPVAFMQFAAEAAGRIRGQQRQHSLRMLRPA